MERSANKTHLRKGRIIAALLGVILTILITDALRRQFFMENTTASFTVEGSFAASPEEQPANTMGNDPNVEETSAGMPEAGYVFEKVECALANQGMLVLPDSLNPAVPKANMRTVDLKSFGNGTYEVFPDSAVLDSKAADALNEMMKAYNEATGLSDFVVYGTDNTYADWDSPCPKEFPDRVTGYTVDLALNAYGWYIGYDGKDEEGWIVDHCHEYGFIVRYPEGKSDRTGEAFCPWHLRYVGKAHAAVMKENNLCLEEYIDLISGYSVNSPYSAAVGGVKYDIFTVPVTGDYVEVKVPQLGNYDISGTCRGSFIVVSEKN